MTSVRPVRAGTSAMIYRSILNMHSSANIKRDFDCLKFKPASASATPKQQSTCFVELLKLQPFGSELLLRIDEKRRVAFPLVDTLGYRR